MSGLCPGAVLEPAAVPPPRFRGPRIHPEPSPSPCPQPPPSRTSVRASGSSAAGRSLPRPRAAGGSCAPPRVTCSRSILRVPGCRRPAGDSGPTVETPRPARRRSVERLAARADEERALRRTKCRLCPVWRRAGAGGRAPAEISVVPRIHPRAPSPSPCPQPPPLPRTAGGSCAPPRGDLRIHPRAAAHQCAVDHHLVQSALLCE